MNFTQIIKTASSELRNFRPEERTKANAKIELLKVIEYNSNVSENAFLKENLEYAIEKTYERATN